MEAILSTPIAPSSSTFIGRLNSKLRDWLTAAEESRPYQAVFDPAADPKFVAAALKFILLETFSYGPHVTEATFTAIGRMPKDRPDLMKKMIGHDLEEVTHGEMALRDFITLGGNEHWARSRRITPATYAMCAVVRSIAATESPFAYLGFMYPFEWLTPILTDRLLNILPAKRVPQKAQHFIEFHAAEDVAHSADLASLVSNIVAEYPEAAEPIEYAADCFMNVYPLPIWEAAYQHAILETSREAGR
jgi:hypothetical protein